jgi:hypothetical protein
MRCPTGSYGWRTVIGILSKAMYCGHSWLGWQMGAEEKVSAISPASAAVKRQIQLTREASP